MQRGKNVTNAKQFSANMLDEHYTNSP